MDITFTGKYYEGLGRRKEAVARVRLYPGSGEYVVNDKPVETYFTRVADRVAVSLPLTAAKLEGKFAVSVKVEGGGVAGQAGAVKHGLARAILKLDETQRAILRKYGLLTRDARVKERKKPGLKRARKAKQYTKR